MPPSLMPPLLTCGSLSLSQSTICELLKRQGYTVQFEGFVELCKEVFFLFVHALMWSSYRLIWSWPRGEHRTADIHLREAWSPSSGCRPCSLPWSAFFISSMRYFTLSPLRRTAHSNASPTETSRDQRRSRVLRSILLDALRVHSRLVEQPLRL